jgi:hypothetical protein
MWIIPTYGRPQSLQRLLHSIVEAVPSLGPLRIKYDPKDGPTAEVLLSGEWARGEWELWPAPNVGCSTALQWAFNEWPAEPFYGFIGDDTALVTKDFFPLMESAATPLQIAIPNDLNWPNSAGPRGTPPLPRHCCIGGDLVREGPSRPLPRPL